MKIFLIIVGVLVVLIALLMSLSATLTLIYDGGWHTSVQVLFIKKDIVLSQILSFILFPEKSAEQTKKKGKEKKENKKRGVMALYALPDTRKLGLTEAQAYAVVWDTFQKIQRQAPRVEVYYGQDTGEKRQKGFDEIGVLLPIHGFEKRMLHHLDEIDGIVLSCREKMMKKAGAESLDLE